jgi:hypothetical protein
MEGLLALKSRNVGKFQRCRMVISTVNRYSQLLKMNQFPIESVTNQSPEEKTDESWSL